VGDSQWCGLKPLTPTIILQTSLRTCTCTLFLHMSDSGSEIGWQQSSAAATTAKERAELSLRSGPAPFADELAEQALLSGPGTTLLPPHACTHAHRARSPHDSHAKAHLRAEMGLVRLAAGPQALERCAPLTTAFSVSMEDGVNALCAQFSADGE
jgi:hypothetical protein